MNEDDLKWVKNEKNISLLLKQFRENLLSKTPRCRKLSHYSQIKNDAFMHREGLTPQTLTMHQKIILHP